MQHLSKKLVIGNKGLSLIEVMIALGVIALSAMALQVVVQGSLRDLQHVQARTMANIVADNVWAQMKIGDEGLQPGNLHGVSLLNNQAWYWSADRIPISTPLVLQVDIKIRAAQTQVPTIEMITYAHQLPL